MLITIFALAAIFIIPFLACPTHATRPVDVVRFGKANRSSDVHGVFGAGTEKLAQLKAGLLPAQHTARILPATDDVADSFKKERTPLQELTEFGPSKERSCINNLIITHRCDGKQDYESWLATHRMELQRLESVTQSLNPPPGGSLLFIGNSHVGEIFESLLCQLRAQIRKWEPVRVNWLGPDQFYQGLPGAQLDEQTYGLDVSDGVFHGPDHVCHSHELARATLESGFRLYAAYNNQHLYGGKQGIQKLLRHLDVDIAALTGIVLGEFNPFDWARVYLANSDYPPNSRWELPEIVKLFDTMGFRGKMLLFEPETELETGKLKFDTAVVRTSLRGSFDNPPTTDGSHACLPGSAWQVASEVASALLVRDGKMTFGKL